MKLKMLVGCLLVVAMLTVSAPALAYSLGVSPPSVNIEVAGGGSTAVTFRVHYFDGDVGIALEDIPLRVEPTVLHVESSGEPEEIVLTIFGDNSLGSQVYDGKIKFTVLSKTGGALAGVKVRARVTNVSDGVPVLPPPPSAPAKEPEPVIEKPAPEAAPTPQATAETSPQAPPAAKTQPSTGLPLMPVLIGIGAVIVLMLLIMAGIAIGRRI